MAAKAIRLDIAMVERGLVHNRSRARAMILAGDVTVDDIEVTRAGAPVEQRHQVALKQKPRFVGRGGEKIDHALMQFDVDVTDAVGADLGACTGGFTDALLQRGAARVYAIDVGYGQLDYALRQNRRVVVMERINARYLESLPEPVDITVIDVSFISLGLMFPAVDRILASNGVCIPLIKPQFEAGRHEVGKGGVVRDRQTHRAVLERVIDAAGSNGLLCHALTASPITGPAGNHEFLGLFRRTVNDAEPPPQEPMIDAALDEIHPQDRKRS